MDSDIFNLPSVTNPSNRRYIYQQGLAGFTCLTHREENIMLPISDDDSGRRLTPVVTYILIALNVLVFLLELNNGEAFIDRWAFVPARFLADPAGDFLTIFTSMFMHASWLHLGGNMLYLWIFGDNVEDRLGHAMFIVFYILCGLGATFAQMA